MFKGVIEVLRTNKKGIFKVLGGIAVMVGIGFAAKTVMEDDTEEEQQTLDFEEPELLEEENVETNK